MMELSPVLFARLHARMLNMALAGTTTSSVACRGAAAAVIGGRSGWILRRPFGKLPTIPGKRCPLRDFNFRSCYGRPASLAYGRGAGDGFLSNMNEDTDEMFGELFNNYGKVVFSRKDKRPPTAEIDDDSESLSFAVAMAMVASEVKAVDIKVLFVKPLVYWTRFFIIATAFSRPQIDAIGSKMRDLAEKKYGKVPSGDAKPNSWTLLDYGDVVVHIFLPPQRAFYNLEEFYGNATPIELPFESQLPFRPTN